MQQRTRDQVHVHLPRVLLGEDDEQGFGQLFLHHSRNQKVVMVDILPENFAHCVLHRS